MRKLVLLVGVGMTVSLWFTGATRGAVIPSWQAPSGNLALFPISNEISLYRSYDDAGAHRGHTLQVILINSLKLFTSFNFELTGDFNWRYSYVNPVNHAEGKNRHDYYLELSIVKPVTDWFSVNVQRVHTTFESRPINQFGVRLRL
ncbi:MAG TPA: hypothetical protein VN285_05305 [Candidatus Deferrimicrobium sp.]|nr:hypothetical protein [Candidatus Deferrimicrobium sp.]